MDPGLRLFFASSGRLGRVDFVLAMAVVLCLFTGYETVVGGFLHLLTAWLAHLVLLAAGVSVLSKRLHDLGRSGWWSAVVWLVFVIVCPQPEGVVDDVLATGLVVAGLYLALAPGQPAFNRFGAPPK